MGLVNFALQGLQTIARPADQQSEARKSQPVEEQHIQHARIDGTSIAHDRLRMLGAEEPNGEVDKRDAQRTENGKHGREKGSLSTGRKAAQEKIADIDPP